MIDCNLEEQINKFEELEISKDLLRGIFGKGWQKPSAIQKKGIMPIIRGRDCIAQAQSGSGKTGTFLIGSLANIDQDLQQIQVVILSPTRELAEQTYKNALELTNYLNIKCHLSIGGTPIHVDKKNIAAGPQMVIGTPG